MIANGLGSRVLDFLDEGNSNSLLFILNCKNQKIRWSNAALEFFGIDNGDYNKIFKNIVHPEKIDMILAEFDDVIKKRKPDLHYTLYLKNANGEFHLCTVKAKYTKSTYTNDETIIGIVSPHATIKYNDPITNLKSVDQLIETIKVKSFSKQDFSSIAIDINKFHEINSIYGYNLGNKILFYIAKKLQQSVKGIGEVYKLYSSNFAILIKDELNVSSEDLFKQIKEAINKIEVDGITVNITITGAAIKTKKYNSDPQGLVSCLISAIEKSKDNNYELVILDDKAYESDTKRLQMLNSIKSNILDGCKGFFLKYQPFVSPISGKVIGAEGLLRWYSEEYGGEVGPYQFIDYIETQPCFYQLGLWIIRRAITDMKDIVKENPNFFVNVNISYSQLQNEAFGDDVMHILDELQFPPSSLQFELTERCRNIDITFLKRELSFFKEKGISIALDDFGTGIASIDLLCNLPITSVKIDQTFIRNILTNSSCKSVVDMSLECAKKLGLSICLEGVENKEIHEYVRKLNATYHQGYYYSKPVTLDEFMKSLGMSWDSDKISLFQKDNTNTLDVNNILSMMPGGFFMYLDNKDEKIISINEAVLELYECKTVDEFYELTKGSFKGMVHPGDYERITDSIDLQIDMSKDKMDVVEYRIVTKTGKIKYVIDYGHLVTRDVDDDVFYVFITEKV